MGSGDVSGGRSSRRIGLRCVAANCRCGLSASQRSVDSGIAYESRSVILTCIFLIKEARDPSGEQGRAGHVIGAAAVAGMAVAAAATEDAASTCDVESRAFTLRTLSGTGRITFGAVIT